MVKQVNLRTYQIKQQVYEQHFFNFIILRKTFVHYEKGEKKNDG